VRADRQACTLSAFPVTSFFDSSSAASLDRGLRPAHAGTILRRRKPCEDARRQTETREVPRDVPTRSTRRAVPHTSDHFLNTFVTHRLQLGPLPRSRQQAVMGTGLDSPEGVESGLHSLRLCGRCCHRSGKVALILQRRCRTEECHAGTPGRLVRYRCVGNVIRSVRHGMYTTVCTARHVQRHGRSAFLASLYRYRIYGCRWHRRTAMGLPHGSRVRGA
jgi:hypothetical protein